MHFSVFFAFNYAFSFYVAKPRLSHMYSIQGIVDMVTIGPVVVQALDWHAENSDAAGTGGLLRLMRVLKVWHLEQPPPASALRL